MDYSKGDTILPILTDWKSIVINIIESRQFIPDVNTIEYLGGGFYKINFEDATYIIIEIFDEIIRSQRFGFIAEVIIIKYLNAIQKRG